MTDEQYYNGHFNSKGNQIVGANFFGSVTIDSSGSGGKDDDDDLTWNSCAQSLAFEGSRLREAVIDRHTDGTCEWLFQSPAYLRWAEEHGILLIRGNPGCGKSTLLKFALERHQEEAASLGGLTLSFFFYSNGTELQKSLAGITRFLLLQLCQQDISAQSSFHDICRKRWLDEGKPELLEWHPKELQDIFEKLVLECSTRRQTTLLIDAVDECRDEDRDALIRLFHRLKGKAQKRLDRPRVCLACRLYPDARIDQDFLIRLEETNHGDIQSFIDQELHLPDETESAVNSLKQVLSAKADGIFLWLVLVIQQVHVMSSKGLNLKFIESEILKSPNELDGLYEDLVNKIEDTDLLEAGKLFQWVCFTGRHLSLDELRIAMTVYLTGTKKFLAEYENESNPHYIMNDRKMKKRMVYLSRGLVGITNPLAVEGRSLVGFYHETIERFMLTKGFLQLNSRLTDSPNLTETAHFQLANTCIDYLSTEEVFLAISEGQQEFEERFCFLDYATTNWLSHAIRAEHSGSGESVKWPSQSTIDLWVTIFKVLKTNPTWVPEEGTSLMHIAAENGLQRLGQSLYSGTSLNVTSSSTTANPELRGFNCVPRVMANLCRLFIMSLDDLFSFHIRPITATILTPLYALKFGIWRALENYGRLQSENCLIEKPKRQETQGSEMQLAATLPNEQSCLSNAKNKAGDTPLHLAARHGSIDMTKLLHKHESSTEAVNLDSCNALHLASDNGHLQVVEFLHEHGMDSDTHTTTVDGSTHLYSASWNGHLEVVKFLYKHGAEADIRKPEKNGFTPFYSASRNGHLDVVKFLYEHGAAEDLSKRTKDGLTPFYGASKYGHLHMVKFLYSLGADVDIHTPTYQNVTPLYSASDNGHFEVVKFLCDHGADADINTPTERGDTPLFAASLNGHLNVVRFLCENGANVTLTAPSGWTAIKSALSRGHSKVVEFLFNNVDDGYIHEVLKDGWACDGHIDIVEFLFDRGADRYINTARPDGSTLLHLASKNDDIEVVRLLIAKGADMTLRNGHGWTPLHAACMKGSLQITKLLLEMGASINIGNKDGWTPLHEASFHGHLDICRLLLEKKADIFAKSTHHCDPLHVASNQGHLDICRLLLETGASTNNQNKDGWTSLHEASFHGHLGTCRLLLEKGADIIALNDHDWTPLHAASASGSTQVVKLLLGVEVDIDMRDKSQATPLHAASYHGHLKTSQILLENGADILSKDEHGWTPLHKASYQNHLDICHLLVKNGADLTIKNNHGWTPLHVASMRGLLQITKLFLENRACIDIGNKDGWTSLHEASFYGHHDICKLLLDNGADKNVADHEGRTPVFLASQEGHLSLVQLLSGMKQQTVVINAGRTSVAAVSEGDDNRVVEVLEQ